MLNRRLLRWRLLRLVAVAAVCCGVIAVCVVVGGSGWLLWGVVEVK